MPAVYEKLGVRFLYPENWSITEEDDEGWPRTVTLQSRDTGFWTLHVYPPLTDPGPIVDELISAIRGEFRELEVLPAAEVFGDTPAEGVDIAFFYLDLLVEAKIRHVQTPSSTLIWHYQAESHDFEQTEPVFQAIAVSMLRTHVAIEKA